MMATEIFNIDASWAEKLMKTRVSFLAAPTVVVVEQQGVDKSKVWVSLISHVHVLTTHSHCIAQCHPFGFYHAQHLLQ